MRELLFIIIVLSIAACSSDDVQSPINPAPPTTEDPSISEQGTIQDFQQAMVDFGFKSFLTINDDSPADENIIISPLSIETALYMTSNGAVDETLEEMRMALELGDFFPSGINQFYSETIEQINNDTSDDTFLRSAQAVFWNRNLINVFEDFQNNMQDSYLSLIHI